MNDNINSKQKIKNIRFNATVDEDKIIMDYFNKYNENFSKITKKLLIQYIENKKNNQLTNENEVNKPIMEVLEYHTKLLKEILEKGVMVANTNQLQDYSKEEQKEEKKADNSDFNMDFLNQLKG